MKDKFYVGQRVRSLAAGRTVPVGTHGTITRYGYWRPLNDGIPGYYYSVVFDGFHSGFMDGGYSRTERTMEPIYDGDQKTAWSESTWAPMHLRSFKAPKVSEPDKAVSK